MNRVNVEITLGDAADIFLMIEQQVLKIEEELHRISGVPDSELAIAKLINRKRSFLALQEKFDL